MLRLTGAKKLIGASILSVCAPALAKQPISPSVAIVTKLYKVYAWEAVLDERLKSNDELILAPRSVLNQFFDKRLTNLLLKDRECQQRERGICNLDFVPWWDGQDPGATELKVHETEDPSLISVQFQYPGSDVPINLTYRVVDTPAGWRISDIRSDRWSLIKLLEGKP